MHRQAKPQTPYYLAFLLSFHWNINMQGSGCTKGFSMCGAAARAWFAQLAISSALNHSHLIHLV